MPSTGQLSASRHRLAPITNRRTGFWSATPLSSTLQPVIEEGEMQLVDRVLGLGPEIDLADFPLPGQVYPGTDHQPLPLAGLRCTAALAHPYEVLDPPGEEDVVPAAEVQGRDLYGFVAVADAPLLPVVVARVVLDPVEVVGRQFAVAGGLRQVIDQRQMFVESREILDCLGDCVELGLLTVPPGAGQGDGGQRPGLLEGLVQRASLVGPAVVVIRRCMCRCDRGERRRGFGGRQPLGGADIGEAVHANLAIRSGEISRPFDCVVAVLRLVPERVELAFRGVLTTYVLDDDDIAVGRVILGGRVDVGLSCCLVVGQPLQQHGVGPVLLRPVDVCHKDRAVAHLDRHIDLLLDRALARLKFGLGGKSKKSCDQRHTCRQGRQR